MKAGWEVKPLGEVCSLIKRGIAPKYIETGGIVVINQKCIRDHRIDFNLARRNDLERKIVPDERLIQIGDVLVNSTGTGTLGRVAQVRLAESFPATVDTHVTIVRPSPGKFFAPFFGYMMRMIEDEIAAAGQGVGGQTELSREALTNSFMVSYPDDLEEQKRIVAVLDAAFEGLTRAKKNARANLQNARELFENAELELFNKHTGHVVASKLGDFADFRNGLNYSKNSTGQMIKIVGVGDFQDHFWMPLEQLKSVSIEGKLSDQDMIREDDILAVRSNGNKELIGRVMLAGSIEEQTSFSGFTIRIRLNSGEVLPVFVCYFMKTKAMRKLLSAGGDGANINNLNQQLLSNLEMRVPSKKVQRQVIEEAKELREAFDDLLISYRTKLADIAELRQSLLQKAFAGELT